MKRALTALLLLGCTKTPNVRGAFNTDWLNDGGRSIGEVERRLHAVPPPPQVNVAVGVSADSVIGVPLDGGRRWSHRAQPDSLPSVAGGLVLYSEKGSLTALDAGTGAVRWKVDVESYRLRGAGDDGTTTVASLGQANAPASLLLTVRRDGSVRARIETPAELGRPAARGGIAFIPWSGQYVSALDMETGEEAGRLLSRELTSHALSVAGQVFFGEKSLLHFDERIRFATTNQSGPPLILPERALPGKPLWLGPGGEIPALDSGARARIRIVAAPVWTGSENRFASDRFVGTYFRAVMAFEAKSAALSWVRAVPSDVLAGAAAKSGFVLCTADGKAVRLGARGSEAGQADFAAPLRACVVEASTFVIPESARPTPLARQLSDVLSELDPKMAAAQAFLVGELARIDDASITKTLIELTTSSRIPPDVRARARELLALRRSGADFMLAALEHSYDFLSGTLPPPVGPLAQALAALGERRAAPLLARHLNDPSTVSADVEQAARALAKLADKDELPSLRTFFALYRATADESSLVNAVVFVAEALLRLGGTEGRALVERAARDPLTRPEVAKGILPLLSTPSNSETANNPQK